MNFTSAALLAGKMIEPFLTEIWSNEKYESLKATVSEKLRAAADLTDFTEADDVLVEKVIAAANDKVSQDALLDILEDASLNTPFKPIVHNTTCFFRTLFNIPDND